MDRFDSEEGVLTASQSSPFYGTLRLCPLKGFRKYHLEAGVELASSPASGPSPYTTWHFSAPRATLLVNPSD